MKTWHLRSQRNSGHLGVMPVDRKRNRSITKHAEIECVVCVLPDVVAAEYEILPKRLLQARMKLIAESGLECSLHSGTARQQRIQYRVGASGTRQNQVLV